jgi:hypothetical protein
LACILLTSKGKALVQPPVSQKIKRELGMVVNTCNASTQGAEEDHKFKTSRGYLVSSTLAWAT